MVWLLECSIGWYGDWYGMSIGYVCGECWLEWSCEWGSLLQLAQVMHVLNTNIVLVVVLSYSLQ